MKFVPETKGVALEKIEDTMINHRSASATTASVAANTTRHV
ncbi:hypothetical protein [Asaia platycodi]|nr:hypothetical protein [Asaia platycodi]